jgi:probable F420-dependent oxidoreductase
MAQNTRLTGAELGPVGIWSPELRTGARGAVRDAAAELESLGWGALWIPGLSGADTLEVAENLLDATTRVTVATGVVSIWSHPAELLAATHHRLAEVYDHRLLTGIGSSNAASAQRAGRAFPGALTAMDEYLDELDACPDPLPLRERFVAALGPRMTELATRRSRGLHPFLVTPQHTRAARAAVGPSALIAPHQAVVLERDPDLARAAARDGIGMYIGFPSYQANLRRLGFDDADLVPGGSNHLIDEMVAWGDLDVIATRIADHHTAGADHVALHVLPSRSARDVRAVWRELAAMLPGAAVQAQGDR